MLHLRRCILVRLLSSPATSISPLHRLLSVAAPAISPSPGFAVEDYLVDACGLSRAQALKASTKLSHLKSPSKPDAVLAFLADLGLSSADVAALVVKDPSFLCAGVERTLIPTLVGLTGLGLSHSEIASLGSLAPRRFRCRSVVSSVQYLLHLFGSYEKLLGVLGRTTQRSVILGCNLEKVVKPNVAFLQECGIEAAGIASLCIQMPRILATKPEHVQAMAVRAEAVGVPRGRRMFRRALEAVAFLSKEKIAVRVDYLRKAFRWSDAEVGVAVCKAPKLLVASKEMLRSKSEFLCSVVRLEPSYIAHRPVMVMYSLEGRTRPRYHVLKFLKENGLLHRDRDYYSALMLSEKTFVEKFIRPHKEEAPHLAEDYAAVCRGELPTRFKLT